MKREFTEEVKKQLVGLLPVSQKKGIPFKPDIYRGDLQEFAPTIYIRSLTVDEQSSLLTELHKADVGKQNSVITKYAHLALISIENLIDFESGDYIEIPTKNGKVEYEFFKTLPTILISTIYREVEKVSGVIELPKASEAEGLE